MDLRLAIFDMDGTILDSQASFRLALDRCLLATGYELDAETDPLSGIGLSPVEMFQHLLPGIDQTEATRVAQAYKDAYVAVRAETGAERSAPPYAGAIETLKALAARDDILLGIATGKARRGVDIALDALQLTGRFQTIQTADFNPSKPAPAMVLNACAETGIDPANAVMIGDTSYDIQMGRAAGARTLGVTWGYHDDQTLTRARADILVHAFADVPAALNSLWGRS